MFFSAETYPQSNQIRDSIKEFLADSGVSNNIEKILDEALSLPDSSFNKKSNLLLRALSISLQKSGGGLSADILYELGLLNFRNNNFIQSKSYYFDALRIHRKRDNAPGIRLVNEEIGYCYQRLGVPDSAEYFFTRDVELSKKLNNDSTLANAYANLGHVNWRRGIFGEALKYFGISLEIRRALGLKEQVASSLNSIGSVYWKRGGYAASLPYFLESLKIREELSDKEGRVISLNNIGSVYQKLRYYDKAEEYFGLSLQLSKISNYKFGESYTLYNLGLLELALQNYSASVDYLKKSLEISRVIGDLNLNIMTTIYLGENFEYRGDFETALDYYRRAAQNSESSKDSYAESFAKNNISRVLLKRGDPLREIAPYLEASNKISEFENLKEIKKENYGIFSALYKRERNYQKSMEYYEKFLSIQDSILNEKLVNNITDIIVRSEIEKTESENQLLKKEKELQLLELESKINQRNLTLIAAALSILLAMLVVFLYRNKSRYSNEIVSQKNKLVELNKQLSATVDELNKTNSIKNKYFSILAHDLRGPFMPIISIVDYLLDEWGNVPPDEMKKHFALLKLAADSLYQLLQNLLSWSMFDQGKVVLSPVNINLYDETEFVINLYRAGLETKKLTIQNSVPSPLMLSADKELIQVLLRNLMSNAIKFSNPNGKITVSGGKSSDGIVFSISDDGVGMEKETLAGLTDLESFSPERGTLGEKGTGLGLSLCREIVNVHSGQLKIESASGAGTTVACVFPWKV